MRPIKFRARGIDGETYFGDVYHFKKVVGIHVCGDGTFEVIPESIAQLVGYDKDGNEVYEDDEVVDENGLTGTALLVSEVMGRKNGQFWFVPCKPNFKLKEVQS